MQVFNLKKMTSASNADRQKNIFFQRDEFKTRIIDLKPREEMPTCQMESYVLFYVIAGSAQVAVDHNITELTEGQCLITEPATLAMKSENGVRIMGVQIKKSRGFGYER